MSLGNLGTRGWCGGEGPDSFMMGADTMTASFVLSTTLRVALRLFIGVISLGCSLNHFRYWHPFASSLKHSFSWSWTIGLALCCSHFCHWPGGWLEREPVWWTGGSFLFSHEAEFALSIQPRVIAPSTCVRCSRRRRRKRPSRCSGNEEYCDKRLEV